MLSVNRFFYLFIALPRTVQQFCQPCSSISWCPPNSNASLETNPPPVGQVSNPASTMNRRAKAMVVATLSSANHGKAAMTGFICPSRGGMGNSLLFPALSHGGSAPRCWQKRGDVRLFSPSKTRFVRTQVRLLRWSGKAGKAVCSRGGNR